MKLSKYASLVKRCGRCIVARVEGSGIWLGTDSALYRATELPEPEGEDQVRAMLDLPEKAWNKVYMSEIRAESTADVLGMELSPCAAGEQDADKQKLMAAHNGLWCACYRCREDGELIFFDEEAREARMRERIALLGLEGMFVPKEELIPDRRTAAALLRLCTGEELRCGKCPLQGLGDQCCDALKLWSAELLEERN